MTDRRIGYVLAHEQFAPPDLVECAVAAEEAGFDAVWASDHFHPWQDNQGHCGHAWITLAAVGQRTRRIAMGTGVTCPIYRYHPAIVAQAFATLAALYPGRLFLGVGTGEALNELPGGGGWGPYAERASRLREAIGLIRRLWSGEWVTSPGTAFPLEDARLYTQPPVPIPIFVAASGRGSAFLAGELGDGWITNADAVPPAPEVGQAYRDGLAAAGKAEREADLLAELYAVVGDEAEALQAARLWQFGPVMNQLLDLSDPRLIERRAGALSSPREVIGSWVISPDPAAHIRRIEELLREGVTQVYVHSPQPDQHAVIDFYGRQVLPAVRRG
jgi:TAT-translocated FGD2 family F420-dependent dehydrogenase